MPVCLSRRGMLAGGLTLVSTDAFGRALALPQGATLIFQVSRNGSHIGTHSLSFSGDPGNVRVAIHAEFRIGFGPVTLFRYVHQGVEQWRDGRFFSLVTETDDDGTRHSVNAQRGAGGILIKAAGQPDLLAPDTALPLTHWAVAAMKTKLFNPETGKMLEETAQPAGAGTVRLADGQAIPATGYTLAGEAPIKDWYDDSGVWAALDAVGRDGSHIAYRRA